MIIKKNESHHDKNNNKNKIKIKMTEKMIITEKMIKSGKLIITRTAMRGHNNNKIDIINKEKDMK